MTAALLLGAVVLVAVGIGIGTRVGDGSDRAGQGASGAGLERRESEALREADRLGVELHAATPRTAGLARENARLRRHLRRLERRLRRWKPKR